MKKLLVVLSFSVLAPILAQSQPWGAVTDGQRNAVFDSLDCPQMNSPGSSQSDLTNVANDPASALNALPAMNAEIRAQIAALQDQLKTMPANDPNRPMIENAIKQLQASLNNQPASNTAKPLSLEQTLSKLRADLSRSLGSGSLAVLEKSPEAQNAGLAARAAYMAAWHGKPQASLGLLLRAAKLEPKNAAHLVNLTALATYFGLYREALVLVGAAEKLGGSLEAGVLQANKGHALLRLSRYADAERVLRAAMAANPNLSEARINLSYAIVMQGQQRCQEARDWQSRGWWRNSYPQALQVATRPTEQMYLTQSNQALPNNIPLVQATYNGQPLHDQFVVNVIGPARRAARIQLEQIKKVPLIAELRDQYLEQSLQDIISTASLGANNNALIPLADQQRFTELEKAWNILPIPQDEAACQVVADNLQSRNHLLRAAYQTSYRAAFAALSRISDRFYRNWGQLQMINIVASFAREITKLEDDIQYKMGACINKPQLEPVVAGAMPPVPSACQAKVPTAAPKQGFAITISCDQITLNFNPPAWIPRFQVLRNSISPLEESLAGLSLTAFSGSGFVTINSVGVLSNVGGARGNQDWRYTFDSSKATPVWFMAAEGMPGR